jgi:hypothetical protein
MRILQLKKFIEMHVDASNIYPSSLVFHTRHRVNTTIYELSIYIQTLTHIQIKYKLWTTVAFLRCCNLIWGLANNNYSLYFLQFLTDSGNLRLCYIFIPYCTIVCTPIDSWTIEQIDRDIILLLKITQIWVITICVVLDDNTHSNISKLKGKGGGGTYKNHWYARLQ